jgi:pimeloyl-ACP methyl ester carboxylesterase
VAGAPCDNLGVAAAALHAEQVRVVLDRMALEDLGRRLRAARLAPDAGGTWARGTPGDWLTGLVADWQAFDPLDLQARLDQLTHLRVEVDGISVHLVHAPATAAGSLPLLLTHGWPSSFLEYWKLLPLLTDAFTVVAPSLPGFGFSGPPPAGGLVHEQVAELWYRIMTDALGYRRFVAHGSDLGAGVTAWLARAHPEAVAAIHLATPGLAAPPPPWSDALTDHFREVEAWSAEEGGYAHMHATKPATIGAALDDSPVALAAWAGEKLTQWSSTAADGQPAPDRDHLLSTLTLYWTTRTAASSLLPYWAYRHTSQSALPPDDPAPTPTAIDIFGGEIIPFPKPPRELAERYFNVVHWAEHRRGGHFPAAAEPQLLAERLRAAFQPYRDLEANPRLPRIGRLRAGVHRLAQRESPRTVRKNRRNYPNGPQWPLTRTRDTAAGSGSGLRPPSSQPPAQGTGSARPALQGAIAPDRIGRFSAARSR